MSRAKKREREKRLNKIEETRRVKRSERNIRQKGRKGNPKVKIMSDRRKAFIKKANALFVLVYLVFCIYRISAYFSWKNIVLQMMNNEPSTIVDSSGDIIEKLGAERNKNNVKLSQVPDNLKYAYIDIEDERFYKHKGVDIKRTTAAIGSYVIHAGKSSFGGSTITQQLVKNLTGNDDNSISRKIEEWVKAEELESFCSKDEILETYFNIIYVAPNTYGVDMGAKYYFNKSVSDLDLAECAFLAGINNSPNSYNPFNEKDNSEKIKKRTKAVLAKMHELKHINDSDYNNAVQEVENGLNFQKGDIQSESNGIYSYHADAVVSEVISDISEKKKMSTKFATNYVYMAGLKIYSTENKEIQQKLEEEYNKSKYVLTSNDGQTSQSAMVIIDHTTGYVVGCVGGLGEKKSARGFNRATQAVRQTGSAIKPIAVLAPGIDKKTFTASTMYNDEPTTFNDGSESGYSPTDNDEYIGEITVRRAVESSQNIPFVKMMEAIGPSNSVKYLKKMGITSLTDKDETLSLALGGLDKGITPLEMAGAYATIANDGQYIEPTFYTKIETAKGKNLMKSKQKKTKVFSKEVAYVLKELLKQPVEGSSGTAKLCKIDGMDVSAKTGTTNDNYDKWLCGFTTYYTAVTWYGYDQNETVSYKGKSPAVQIWSAVMKNVHSNLSKTTFSMPGSIKQAKICAKTGMTATSKCEDVYTEYFLSGTVPSECLGCTGSNNKKKENTTKNNTTKNTTSNSSSENNVVRNTTEENTTTENISVNSTKNNTKNNTSNNVKNENKVNNIENNTTENTTNNTNTTNNNTNTNHNETNTTPDEDETDDGP